MSTFLRIKVTHLQTLQRGRGNNKTVHKLYVAVGGGDGSPVDGISKDSENGSDVGARDVDSSGKLLGADALLQTFCKSTCV